MSPGPNPLNTYLSDMDNLGLDRAHIINSLLRAHAYKAAEEFACSLPQAWQRAESLAQVTRALVSNGQTDEARRLWERAAIAAQHGERSQNAQDRIDSSSVLREIAEDMALAGEVKGANQAAMGIKHDLKRERALEGLADTAHGGKGFFHGIHTNQPLRHE
jgi:hypothetical protein